MRWMWRGTAGLAAVAVAVALAPVRATNAQQAVGDSQRWWSPGEGRVLPALAAYDNPYGKLGVLSTAGPT